MSYIDVVVAPVPSAKKQQYLEHARKAAGLFKSQGALELVECWGDDVPEGKLTSMPMAVKCQDDETVVVSWILWPDKATRDRGMQFIMTDPSVPETLGDMPFDGKRMIWGGFEMLLKD